MENKDVSTLIQSIIAQAKFNEPKITVRNADVEISDGYMSRILRVTLTDTSRTLNLVIKVAPKDPAYREIVDLLYRIECNFYANILPKLDALQRRHTGKSITFVPKYIAHSHHPHLLAIEDLSPQGYTMCDRNHCFDAARIRRVLNELGKFHAISIALQTEDLDSWTAMDMDHVDICQIYKGDIAMWFRDALQKCIRLCANTSSSGILKKLSDVENDFITHIRRWHTPSRKYPSVIAHLDTWCNNFLFRDPDVVLLDFQTAYKASPVLDVSCFLYINGDEDSIKYWRDMVRVYYDSLDDQARKLGCDLRDLYSWEMFLDDWRAYSGYGLVKAILGIPLNTRGEKFARNIDEDQGQMFLVPEWSQRAVERITALITHIDEEKLL